MGPAVDSVDTLRSLIRKGMNLATLAQRRRLLTADSIGAGCGINPNIAYIGQVPYAMRLFEDGITVTRDGAERIIQSLP
jgi:hypothetical protein